MSGRVVTVTFFSSRRRHTRLQGDWSSDVCSSDPSPFRTAPTPALPPHSAGQQPAPFSQLRPHWPPPASPSGHGRAGAESKHAATHAPIPAPSSASPQPAADPSSSTEHAHHGSFACPHYAAVPVDIKVTTKVHLYTVIDLGGSNVSDL